MKRVLVLVLVALVAVGCTDQGANKKKKSARKHDEVQSAETLLRYQKSQPVPERPWSQLRQNLIEIETAQMETTQSTTFFFNQGVADPVNECPSIGFPIPAAYQLTNPDQKAGDGTTIGQLETNGVYTGDSTGTYAICLDAKGDAYAVYWEGFVQAVTGAAEWDATAKRIRLVGKPSFDFSTEREK